MHDRDLTGHLPGRQGRLLFAYLAVHRDRACPRPELVDVLWPEAPPASADTALSALLSKLRRALGDGVLTGRSELRLAFDGDVWIDVEHAAAAARRAEAARQDGDWRAAGAAARDVLSALAGEFLPDCDGPWLHEQRGMVDNLRIRAFEVLADASMQTGELGEAVEAARSAVAAAPFRETAYRLLMEAHESAGNPAEALRTFDDLRRLLREELGTAPGAEAMAVHERLLHGGAPARPVTPPSGAPHAARGPPLARSAGRRARSPRVRRPGRRGGAAARRLAPGRRRHARADRPLRRGGDRQDPAGRRAGGPRAR